MGSLLAVGAALAATETFAAVAPGFVAREKQPDFNQQLSHLKDRSSE
jgi:hypothetical protein